MDRPNKTAAEPTRCLDCGIYIFNSVEEARLYGVPFYATNNSRFGDKCIGCAGGDAGPEALLAMARQLEDRNNEPITS